MKCKYFKVIEYFDSHNEKVMEYYCEKEQKLCSEIDNCYPKQIERLKITIDKLEKENSQYHKYKYLFEKAREFYLESEEWAKKCKAENEDLKDSLKRTICQAECYRYKEAERYKQVLLEIQDLIKDYFGSSKEYRIEQGDWVIYEDKPQRVKDDIVRQIENKIKDSIMSPLM